MTLKVAAGTAPRIHRIHYRFAKNLTPGGQRGYLLDSSHVVEVRKLLRTDMTLGQIATYLGVSIPTIRTFIKRRQLCSSLHERDLFIGRQRAIQKEIERSNGAAK